MKNTHPKELHNYHRQKSTEQQFVFICERFCDGNGTLVEELNMGSKETEFATEDVNM